MKNILILGGSSDLGKELVSLYSEKNNVYTTYNKNILPNRNKLKLVVKFNFFSNSDKKIFFKKISNIKFDVIIFIGAITPKKKNKSGFFKHINYQYFKDMLYANCYFPIKLFQELYLKKKIKNNSKIIFFSSLAGSISNRGKLKHNRPGGDMIYRISKSALNSAIKNLAYDFKITKMILLSLHPGYVKTKSGGKNADLSVAYSAFKIYNLINRLNIKKSGSFLNYNSKKIKW